VASIGLYGILAYTVHQRQREIGLRMALGASRPRVLRMIVKQGLSLAVIGMAIGFAATLLAGRVLGRMLYGVGGADAVSLVGTALAMGVVALVACYVPGTRRYSCRSSGGGA
jgi:ABC-type antimicrobial peptide transport system permease subunit